MSRRAKLGSAVLAAVILVALGATPAVAEDIENKFRISFGGGFLNPQDEVRSDAANELRLVDNMLELDQLYIDPRDDLSVFGGLEIKPGTIFHISGQYAVTKVFVLEASVGHQTSDVGDVEVQVQFGGVDVDERIDFNFQTFRIPVGELTRVPVQLTALARFRSRANFNPYVGGGIGYSFIGLDIAPEFDDLSRNMDSSRGALAFLTDALEGGAPELSGVVSAEAVRDLDGARVSAPDSFEWHLVTGAELTVKKKWALFLDVRYSFSSRSLEIGFDGGQNLGNSVPALQDFADSVVGAQTFGAFEILEGGLIDGGSTQIRPVNDAMLQGGVDPDENPELYCEVNPLSCESFFDLTGPDGEPDTGFYYVQGGDVRYGAFSMQFGFRYTF